MPDWRDSLHPNNGVDWNISFVKGYDIMMNPCPKLKVMRHTTHYRRRLKTCSIGRVGAPTGGGHSKRDNYGCALKLSVLQNHRRVGETTRMLLLQGHYRMKKYQIGLGLTE